MLINGDCIVELKKLLDNSVDLIVTDPPYRCISGGKAKKRGQPKGILMKNDGKLFAYNDIQPEEYFRELYRLLKPGGHCYIMVNVINMEKFLREGREAGFLLHNILVWKKNNATPSRWQMKNAEYTLLFRKGAAKRINENGSMTVHEFKNVKNKCHPTEKPVELMEYYIRNSSKEGDTVLDPFMGSGSTGVACARSKRKFIGIEIDETYFPIAVERITATRLDMDSLEENREEIDECL